MAITTKVLDSIAVGTVFLVWRSKLRQKQRAGQVVGRGTCRPSSATDRFSTRFEANNPMSLFKMFGIV